MNTLTMDYNNPAMVSAMATKEFQAGLKSNEVDRVEYALSLGAVASRTPMHATDLRNPLIPYLRDRSPCFGSSRKTVAEILAIRPRVEEIVHMLLHPENGKLGMPPQDYMAHDGRGGRLAEAVLKDMTDDYQDVSPWVSIVTGQAVRFISQGKNAKLDFQEIFAPHESIHPQQRYKAISQVMNGVRKRIDNPQTCDEKFAYLNYRKEMREWAETLILPPKAIAVRQSLAIDPALRAI
jgi:hypothetical protein